MPHFHIFHIQAHFFRGFLDFGLLFFIPVYCRAPRKVKAIRLEMEPHRDRHLGIVHSNVGKTMVDKQLK